MRPRLILTLLLLLTITVIVYVVFHEPAGLRDEHRERDGDDDETDDDSHDHDHEGFEQSDEALDRGIAFFVVEVRRLLENAVQHAGFFADHDHALEHGR